MKTFDYYIGIDPDVAASGFAIVSRGKIVSTETLRFPDLVRKLRTFSVDSTLVVVEASWLIPSNWHIIQRYGATARAASMGRAVGMNHATGKIIAEIARDMGFDVVAQTPLRKIGHGKDGKLTHEDAAYYMTGLPARTNQEERDAARLAWVAAGLQEKIKA